MNETHIHDPRPLARSEIESVLHMSRSTTYAPRENKGAMRDKNFKKRPFTDIAAAADTAAKPVASEAGGNAQIAEPLADADMVVTPEDTGRSATSVDPSADQSATQLGQTQSGQMQEPPNDEANPSPGTPAEQAESLENQDNPDTAQDPSAAGFTETLADNPTAPVFEPTPIAQASVITDAEVQDRIDEAYARGLAEGDGQARQRLEDGCQRLENLATSLMGHEAVDIDDLASRIDTTILRLASLRAGYAIHEMPAPFSAIVEKLVRRIAKDAAAGTLMLNTADLAVVQPLLESRDSFLNIKFKADDTLAPGDIRVSVGSVEAEDTLAQRVDVSAGETDDAGDLDEIGRLVRDFMNEPSDVVASSETPSTLDGDTPETDTPETDTPETDIPGTDEDVS